jgi:hypothetical protein
LASAGQGAGRIQPRQIIIEHTFNIRLGADFPPRMRHLAANRQHQANPDNTCESPGLSFASFNGRSPLCVCPSGSAHNNLSTDFELVGVARGDICLTVWA